MVTGHDQMSKHHINWERTSERNLVYLLHYVEDERVKVEAYQKLHDRLKRYFNTMASNRNWYLLYTTQDDLIDEVILRLTANYKKINGNSLQFKHYLRRVLIDVCASTLRKSKDEDSLDAPWYEDSFEAARDVLCSPMGAGLPVSWDWLTAVYFLPPTQTLPLSFTALLTHLGLRPTQANVWQGRHCYLDLSQQEGVSQVRLTLFAGEPSALTVWQKQWQLLINHHQQIECLGSTLVYWAVGEEGLSIADWQSFVPTPLSFAEPVLVPRPETAVYLCHQSLGQHVYVALTATELTIHRHLIYNSTFWQLEQLWHQGEQARQTWLAEVDPALLERVTVFRRSD